MIWVFRFRSQVIYIFSWLSIHIWTKTLLMHTVVILNGWISRLLMRLSLYLLHSKFSLILYYWSIIWLVGWKIISLKLRLISWSHWRIDSHSIHSISISIRSLLFISWILIVIIFLLEWWIVLLFFIQIVSILWNIMIVCKSTGWFLLIILRIFQTLELLELLRIIWALLLSSSKQLCLSFII